MLERWAGKVVQESRMLDDMEGELRWRVMEGGPELVLAGEEGNHVLRYRASLKDWDHIRSHRTGWDSFGGKQGGSNGIALVFDEPQDWSAYNRLSLWVYVHPSKNKVIPLSLALVDEDTGEGVYDVGRETNLDLKQGEWQQVLWEIDYYPRKRIRRLELGQQLIGHEPEGEPWITIDLDRVELQRVQADVYEGWDLPEGGIALAQTGYRPQDAKVALARWEGAGDFSLENEKGRTVFRAPVQQEGRFARLDFSAFRKKGVYKLRYGEAVSTSFPIGPEVWLEPLFATLNFFYCQRCGYPVEGIHGVCHQDTQGACGDERRVINGGWHDAGDLSQGFWRTGMSVFALLRTLDVTEGTLQRRLAEEAAWGLDWLLKVRFPGGRHISWILCRIYTDNALGTPDDTVVQAVLEPWEDFLGAAVFLKAAAQPAFLERQAELEQAAREDWESALQALEGRQPKLLEASWGAVASALLYRRLGNARYKEAALDFARVILALQTAGGHFGVRNTHTAFEEAPMLALRELCRTFPEEAAPWREAARRYVEDFAKPGSRLSAPYHLLPMGLDRTFPVWEDHVFHGATTIDLSFAWAVAEASALLEDGEGMALVQEQLEWTLGRNPFCSSFIYGVGYNYAPYFAYCTHNVVGALPVGIDSIHDDLPFWNGSAHATAKEIWVEPANRFLGALSVYLAGFDL